MIDIIVSAYNQEKYLVKCLSSIINQEIEINIIVINPKPTKSYLQIIKKFQNKVNTIIHKIDIGCADGLNNAIPFLKNDHSLVLNGDDYLIKNSLSKSIKYLNNDFDILIGWCILRDDTNNSIKAGRPYALTLKKLIYGLSWIPHPSTIYKNIIFKKGYKFNKYNKLHWDTELLLDLHLGRMKFIYVNDYFSVFRIHDTSLTNQLNSNNRSNKLNKIRYKIKNSYFYKYKNRRMNFFDIFLINILSFLFRIYRFLTEKFTINSKKNIIKLRNLI